MRPMLSEVELTDAEILTLDGKCRPEAQAMVEEAKERLALLVRFPALQGWEVEAVAGVVRTAKKEGYLEHLSTSSSSSCYVCNKSPGYAVYPRNGRHHRKGDVNHSKSLHQTLTTLRAGRFSVWACSSCYVRLFPIWREVLVDVHAEIPESLSGFPSKWKRFRRAKCDCGWSGSEVELGLVHGQKSKCPQCPLTTAWRGGVNFLNEFDVFPLDGLAAAQKLMGEVHA